MSQVSSRRTVGRAGLVLLALLGILAMHGLPMSAAPSARATESAMAHAMAHAMTATSDMEMTPPARPDDAPRHAAHGLSPCSAVIPAPHTSLTPPVVSSPAAQLSVVALRSRHVEALLQLGGRRPPDLVQLCISRT